MENLQETAGWREWLALPEFHIRDIEAKVDTGTRTSVLHASFIEPIRKQGNSWVRFGIIPQPERTDLRMIGFAPVVDSRLVKDSEGQDEVCIVIETEIVLGGRRKTIELTLTKRDSKKFRMVLGRTALQDLRVIVDPSRSHLLSDAPEA
jgi:hypothetical protein